MYRYVKNNTNEMERMRLYSSSFSLVVPIHNVSSQERVGEEEDPSNKISPHPTKPKREGNGARHSICLTGIVRFINPDVQEKSLMIDHDTKKARNQMTCYVYSCCTIFSFPQIFFSRTKTLLYFINYIFVRKRKIHVTTELSPESIRTTFYSIYFLHTRSRGWIEIMRLWWWLLLLSKLL